MADFRECSCLEKDTENTLPPMQKVLMSSVDEKLFASHNAKVNIELFWFGIEKRECTGVPVIFSLQEFRNARNSRRTHSCLPFYLLVWYSFLKHSSNPKAIRELENFRRRKKISQEWKDLWFVFHEWKCETNILTSISDFWFHITLV